MQPNVLHCQGPWPRNGRKSQITSSSWWIDEPQYSEVQTKRNSKRNGNSNIVHRLDFALSSLKTARIVTKQYLTLNDWFRGEQWILFPREIRGKQIKFTAPEGTSCYIAKQNKSKFWKTRWDSYDNIRPPLITCNSGVHFAGNSELFLVWHYST